MFRVIRITTKGGSTIELDHHNILMGKDELYYEAGIRSHKQKGTNKRNSDHTLHSTILYSDIAKIEEVGYHKSVEITLDQLYNIINSGKNPLFPKNRQQIRYEGEYF